MWLKDIYIQAKEWGANALTKIWEARSFIIIISIQLIAM